MSKQTCRASLQAVIQQKRAGRARSAPAAPLAAPVTGPRSISLNILIYVPKLL